MRYMMSIRGVVKAVRRSSLAWKLRLIFAFFMGIFVYLSHINPGIFVRVRKWWIYNVILDQEVTPNVSLREGIIKDKVDKPSMDFEYNYPPPDKFGFVWTASNMDEACSSLTSMLRVYRNLSSKPETSIFYILLTTEAIKKSEVSRRWNDVGGLVEGVEEYPELVDGDLLKRKSFGLPLTWVILLSPNGIPLPGLIESFLSIGSSRGKFRSSALIFGGRAKPGYTEWDSLALTERKCYDGEPTPIISTSVLFFQPTKFLYGRIKSYRRSKFDNTINKEFSCNLETFVLPKDVIIRDTEVLKLHKSFDLSYAIFLHFGFRFKPWTSPYKGYVYDMIDEEARIVIQNWVAEREKICPIKKKQTNSSIK